LDIIRHSRRHARGRAPFFRSFLPLSWCAPFIIYYCYSRYPATCPFYSAIPILSFPPVRSIFPFAKYLRLCDDFRRTLRHSSRSRNTDSGCTAPRHARIRRNASLFALRNARKGAERKKEKKRKTKKKKKKKEKKIPKRETVTRTHDLFASTSPFIFFSPSSPLEIFSISEASRKPQRTAKYSVIPEISSNIRTFERKERRHLAQLQPSVLGATIIDSNNNNNNNNDNLIVFALRHDTSVLRHGRNANYVFGTLI